MKIKCCLFKHKKNPGIKLIIRNEHGILSRLTVIKLFIVIIRYG